MINVLEIKNFKSIRSLKLDCKHINIFIGELNTSKSNILESLGLLSTAYYGRTEAKADQFVKYKETSNLFYGQDVGNDIEMRLDESSLTFRFGGKSTGSR